MHLRYTMSTEETGYQRDLRDAENMIVAAGTNLVALATAFRRHAEAQRNMMIAEFIPAFKVVLEPLLTDTLVNDTLAPLLDDKLKPIVMGIGGLQLGQNHLNEGFQSLSEIVNDLILDKEESKQDRKQLNEKVDRLEIAFATLQQNFEAYTLGSKRADVDALKLEFAAIRGNYTPEQREKYSVALIKFLDKLIADSDD